MVDTLYGLNLGMRSLYIAVAGLMRLFHFLHFGLAGLLSFVGLKMIVSIVTSVIWPKAEEGGEVHPVVMKESEPYGP